jgi:chromosome segregation ATPase
MFTTITDDDHATHLAVLEASTGPFKANGTQVTDVHGRPIALCLADDEWQARKDAAAIALVMTRAMEMSDAEARLEAAEQRAEEEAEAKEDAEGRVEDAEGALAAAESTISDMRTEADDLRNEIADLRNEIAELRAAQPEGATA